MQQADCSYFETNEEPSTWCSSYPRPFALKHFLHAQRNLHIPYNVDGTIDRGTAINPPTKPSPSLHELLSRNRACVP